DRIRTTLNVWGDAVGAGIVNLMSRDDLLELDAQKAENGDGEGDFRSRTTNGKFDEEAGGKSTGSAQLLNETAF
ncbi:hypothetical protein AC249_AIPGENE21294, partial [Exaiptasia diaphana]